MKTEREIAFGTRLREFRLQRELTQEKLALISGLHINYIGSVERGERNISLLNIWKLADALNVHPCDLFGTEKS